MNLSLVFTAISLFWTHLFNMDLIWHEMSGKVDSFFSLLHSELPKIDQEFFVYQLFPKPLW